MAHTSIAKTCLAVSGCRWRTLPGWRWRSAPMSLMTRAASALLHHRVPGAGGRGMTLFDDRSPRIVVLRRKGRTFADARGVCRAAIGCALAGGAGGLRPAASGPAAGGSGEVSGGASTDHPPAPDHNPQVDDPYRRPPTEVFSRFFPPDDGGAQVNPEDDEE
jgi:hypothetical protein